MNRKKKRMKGKKFSRGKISPHSFGVNPNLLGWQKHVEELREKMGQAEDRLEDIEIHVNLLTRLLTTLCIEKFGMRIGVLKRMIKRIEKEAIRDSQILHLEELYKLPHQPDKKTSSPPSKNDPWEEIS